MRFSFVENFDARDQEREVASFRLAGISIPQPSWRRISSGVGGGL
jgi:hypothetical protein